MTKTAKPPKTATELLQMLASVGHQMDAAAPDHSRMCYLLRARRAITASLEARHAETIRQS